MTVEAPYANVERLLVADLADFGKTGTIDDGTRPFVRPRRIGGTDDGVTDRARVVVDVLAKTYAQAWDIARDLQQYMISGPRRVPGVGIIDRATTNVGPQEAPHDDQQTRLVTAIYDVSSRRPR